MNKKQQADINAWLRMQSTAALEIMRRSITGDLNAVISAEINRRQQVPMLSS